MNSSTKHKKNNTPALVCDQVLGITSSHQMDGIFQINIDIKEVDNITAVTAGQVTLTFSNTPVVEYATYNIGDDIKTATPIAPSAGWATVLAHITNNPLASDTETILFDKWNFSIATNTIKFDNTTNAYPLDITLEYTPDGVCFATAQLTSLPIIYSMISRRIVADSITMNRFNTDPNYEPFLLQNDADTISSSALLDTSKVDNLYAINRGSEVYSVVTDYNNLSTIYSDINPSVTGNHPPFPKNIGIEHLFQQKIKWNDGYYTGARAYNEQMVFPENSNSNWQNTRIMFALDTKIGLDFIRDIEVFTLNFNRINGLNNTINLDIQADFSYLDSQTPPVSSTPISNFNNSGITSFSFDFQPFVTTGAFFRIYMDGAFPRYNNSSINYLLRSYVDVKVLSA